jgi:hypothetical protein
MGKASSSKKVQRAARAAGRPGAGRQWGWPLAIGGLVVLGILLIVVSRGFNEDADPPIIGDHWHTAYGIYNCDAFIPPLSDEIADASGLHTHDDSLMHIHPFSTAYTGERATINAWGETTGLELTNESIDAPGIHVENGDDCPDGPATVQVMKWDSIADEAGELLEDPGDYALQDGEIITIAFVTEGTEIPKPDPQVLATLQAPPDVTGQPSPTVLTPDDTSNTVPVDPTPTSEGEGTTDTTAATTEDTTTDETTPPDSTPTTAAP